MTHPTPPDAPIAGSAVGSAPTRVCLGGEDLDWIGGPALLTAVDLRVEVSYCPVPAANSLVIRAEGALRSELHLTRDTWCRPTTNDLELVRLCWQHAVPAAAGGRIDVHSAAPANAGLASSATACVATLHALVHPSRSDGMTADDWMHAAYEVEHDVAGRPVGPMDFVPAVVGGTHLIDCATETITSITPVDLSPEARFLVVDTRIPRDTGAVVAWKRTRLAGGDRGMRHYARRMPQLVQEQARLASDDLPALGQALDEAHALLRCHQLVSTPLIDTCIERLRANGALGAKLTGTGMGGCVFALTTDTADNTRLLQSLDDLPVTIHLVTPAHHGAGRRHVAAGTLR